MNQIEQLNDMVITVGGNQFNYSGYMNIRKSKYWDLIKEIHGTWLKPMPFSCSMVVIFLAQLCIAKKWLNNPVGKYYGFGILVALLIVAIGTDWIGNTRIFDFWKIKEITPLDTFLYSIILTTCINLCCFILHVGIISRNIVLFFVAILFVAVSIFFKRLSRIYETQKNNLTDSFQNEKFADFSNGLIDLRDLYNGPVKWQKDDGAIVVDERAVDYDLFDRDMILNQLTDAINQSTVKSSYVVGLVGDWGTGKTTLLNELKHKYINDKETVFIHAPGTNKEDFDLWLFGSKDEMIRGLYETFLDNIGIKYSSFKIDKMLENVSKVVAGVPNSGGMIGPLIGGLDSYPSVLVLKRKLTEYIRETHKHYVMCIENLDRAKDDQIILFLKLINTVFDFPNVTYVLLYDNTRINKILKNERILNENYKEKVINQEIRVPLLIDTTVSIKCMQNLLLSYGFRDNDLDDFYEVLEAIAKNLTSIRDLKRIINSVFTVFAHKDEIRLNYPQLLGMQYLFYSEPKLYKMLKDDKDWLIVTYASELKEIVDSEVNILKNISLTYPKYKNLLEILFPKIGVANKGGKIGRADYNWDQSKKDRSIFISGCFDSYFTLKENEYVKINNLLHEFVKEVNIANTEDLSKIWDKYILSQDIDQIKKQLAIFITIEDISSLDKREKLSEIIFQNVIENKTRIDEYNLAKYVGIFIGEIKKAEFKRFKEFVLSKYNTLEFVKKIVSYMNGQERWNVNNTDEFLINRSRMKNLYTEMRNKILRSSSNINLYSKRYYRKSNSFGLLFKDDDDVKFNVNNEVTKYIAKCVNSFTIYNILEDAVNNTGKANKEIIAEPFAEALKKTKNKIENIFKKNPPKTDREKELVKIYYEFAKANE